MATINDQESNWGSRRTYVMVLLCQILGTAMFVDLANAAITLGSTGYILSYMVCCIFVGIPLLYMEFIIGQFTARDAISVWKARPCVSHIGYIIVLWQVINIFYNHVINSFIFHYLLISFENPIPYYTCGSWSTKNCNILVTNFTTNEDCIRYKNPPPYCTNLHSTFPEYQYWRYRIMGVGRSGIYHIAWRVSLASGLICAITFLCVFRRKRSLKWVVQFFTVFPLIGYILLLMGSMLQKGIVVKYHEALDSDFSIFVDNFRVSGLIMLMVYNIGIGSGITFNLVCSSSFRAPCYADTVVCVVVIAGASALAVCASAMMACPYAYEYGIEPYSILKTPMSLLFEKTPRFLYEYRHRYFYVVLIYGSHAVLGTSTNIILIFHLIEMAVARIAIVAKYPGLTCFLGILLIFFISIPLMCSSGLSILFALRKNTCVLAVFIALIETCVFIIWYGLDKFSEDVHFMQGLPPTNYMKVCWMLSIIFLSYTFVAETYERRLSNKSRMTDIVAWYMLLITVGLIVTIFILKLIVAASRKKFKDVFTLDLTWGPRSEVLQRSRAMFTAQAMTKEYLYRQYHLQAGITARQKTSNCRTVQREF